MSCRAEPATFRLLDAVVGWESLDATGLDGATGVAGDLSLARISPDAVDPSDLLPFLPPARLAPGCGPCAWYMVTPSPSRLLRLRCGALPPPCEDPYPCGEAFLPIPCLPDLSDGVAVAATRHLVAFSDRGAGEVRILGASGEETLAVISVAEPGPLAFTPWRELLVACGGTVPGLRRFSLAGNARGEWLSPLPEGSVDRLAFAGDGALWIVMKRDDGSLSLWRATRKERECEEDRQQPVLATPSDPRALAGSFPPTTLVMASREGFCLRDTPQGPTCCFDGYGRPVESLPAPPPIPRARRGQLLTLPIDSGMPRCRWHRVRLEATVPPGTSLTIAVATAEDPLATAQGNPVENPGWETLPAGNPHPEDWDPAPQGSLDYLVRQPPGRYLHLRLRLSGDGAATPVVHRIRIDFPRSTSLEHLPPVYREDPRAEDFTERFLSLFDASIESLDEAIERAPAMLDTQGVPPSMLPWLGTFLDLAFETSWTADRRRALIAATALLYRKRGTREGLAEAIRRTLDVEPVIQELSAERAWGAVSKSARLGSVRLFSRARARFTLGTSVLCGAPLRAFGDPALDPLTGAAWRLRVLVPALDSPMIEDRLTRLLESQKPAHTAITTRFGGQGFVVGSRSAAGIDTALAPLPAPVLGGAGGNTRLARATVLWTRRGGKRGSFSVGETAAVGVNTVTS